MKTKHFLGVVIGLLLILFLIVVGNIITIGDKLSSVSPIFEWVFYIIIGTFVIIFILIPIVRVILTPEIEGQSSQIVADITPEELSSYIKRLKLSKEQQRNLAICNDRRSELLKILGEKKSEMDSVVKKSAITTFVITAISQNGSLDLISAIGLNFRMINSLIKLSGYRPSYLQITKLYLSVFSASIVITSVDDILDDVDFGEMLGGFGIIVSNVITRSATNGAMNAFVCLRIGYATMKYLEIGSKKFEKEKSILRKEIRKKARQNLYDVSKEGIKEGKNKLASIFG